MRPLYLGPTSHPGCPGGFTGVLQPDSQCPRGGFNGHGLPSGPWVTPNCENDFPKSLYCVSFVKYCELLDSGNPSNSRQVA